MPNGMPCKKMALEPYKDDLMRNQITSREHFRPQANKSYQSRIFFLYLKKRIIDSKNSSNTPKMTYFILFRRGEFFGMLLEHWSEYQGYFSQPRKTF
jgi:hypothetical protein